MTTTEEVPMPEPYSHNCTGDQLRCADGHGCECAMAGHGPEPVEYTADQLRAYADARCAKIRAELVEAINAEMQARRERDALAEKVKAMEDNDRRYRWLREANLDLHTDIRPAFELGDEHLDAAIDAAGGVDGGGDG